MRFGDRDPERRGSHDPLAVWGRCQGVSGAWAGECPSGSIQSLLGWPRVTGRRVKIWLPFGSPTMRQATRRPAPW